MDAKPIFLFLWESSRRANTRNFRIDNYHQHLQSLVLDEYCSGFKISKILFYYFPFNIQYAYSLYRGLLIILILLNSAQKCFRFFGLTDGNIHDKVFIRYRWFCKLWGFLLDLLLVVIAVLVAVARLGKVVRLCREACHL